MLVCLALLPLMGAPARAAFDVPTGMRPSPLFGAQPFTQKLLRFEEFGVHPLPVGATPVDALPDPGGCNGPAQPQAFWSALDAFLLRPLYPAPTAGADAVLPNPWASTISGCIGRPMTGYADGRPPGVHFSHQRWGEFTPTAYFKTAQAGARVNSGLRDAQQMHGYSVGEFGPGGLYHNTNGVPGFNGTTAGTPARFHPLMPEQSPEALWTFDGTFPPKLLMARYGTPLLFRHYNALPISDAANRGFGRHTITTHEHNGHNPAESDGYAGAYFFPGQYFDYRWPMILAGHDSINTGATDPRAGAPDGNGGIRKIRGDWRETMSTHWFHDHMIDFTAQNVYKGNAAMMNYYSAIDRGREPATEAEAKGLPDKPGYGCHYANPNNVNLCLPSGSGLDWGNRDYDVNLMVADKAWDASGQLAFNVFNTDGFLGDVPTVNFQYAPYLDVRARRYRFRILNGSVSRYFKIALVDAAGNPVPFYMVANDGNIMEHAVRFPNPQAPESLPEQAIAERYDIVVDFSAFNPGDRLYFVNLLEHDDGKGPKEDIPLREVISGEYSEDGCPDDCDPMVGKFMELRVHAYSGVDRSMNPADYVEGKKKMIPLPGFTAQELANAKERTFEFGRGSDDQPWTIKTDDGIDFTARLDRVSAAPDVESVEIWHIVNGGGGWAHPVHVHFEEAQILQRDDRAPPPWEKGARKDIFRIGDHPDSSDSVTIAIRVRDFIGTYVEHCHNTQHEDHAMLLRWDSQNPDEVVPIPAPFPSWDGVSYTPTNTIDVPTFKTGQATRFLTDDVLPPVARNDAATTTATTPTVIDVLVNDTCIGRCDPALVTIVTQPTRGFAVPQPDGTVLYTSVAGFTGEDSFRYTTRDTTTGRVASNAARVTVTVTGPPPVPVAVDLTATTRQGTPVVIDLAAHATHCEGGCTASIVTPSAHATVVANLPLPGQVIYGPNASYFGADTFTYVLTNTSGASNAATVTVTVVATDVMPPAAPADFVAVPGVQRVDLSWTNPAGLDFQAVRILRSTSDFAATADETGDQTVVYEGAGTSFADAGLVAGTSYRYTAFARDVAGNWSTPAQALATPSAPVVGSVFTDDFDACSSSIDLGADWSVVGRWYCASGRARGETANGTALVNGHLHSDVEIAARVRLTGSASGSGPIARAGSGAFYAARLLSGGSLQLVRMNGAVATVLAELPAAFSPDGTHQVTLRVTGHDPVLLAASLDGAFVLEAVDASAGRLLSGQAGLLSGSQARTQFDDFAIHVVGGEVTPPPPPPPPPPPGDLFADDFDACSASVDLGADWTISGRWYCASGRARGESANGTALADGLVADTDVSARVKMTGAATGSGIVARAQAGVFYAARVLSTGSVQLVRMNGATASVLAMAPASVPANSTNQIALRVTGSNPVRLQASFNDALLLDVTDSSAARLLSGQAGLLSGSQARTQFDDFSRRGVGAGPPPPPPPPPGDEDFADDFDACTSTTDLGATWETDGQWYCASGRARGESAGRVATARAAVPADITVQARVRLTGDASGSGVVARAAAGSFYAARLLSTGRLQLVRMNAGTPTVLSDVAVNLTPDSTHSLGLTVTGDAVVSLSASFNGATVATATDASPSRLPSGAAGLLSGSSARTQFDDFSATAP